MRKYIIAFIICLLIFNTINSYGVEEIDIDIIIGNEDYTKETEFLVTTDDEDESLPEIGIVIDKIHKKEIPVIKTDTKPVSTENEIVKINKKIEIIEDNPEEIKITKTEESKIRQTEIIEETDSNTEDLENTYLRPAAVMVENEPPARPQSGLNEAQFVFEIVAEEITRYMAIYYDLDPNVEVGPVRSARDYFADISTMFDAVYVHCGGSPRGLKFIKDNKLNNINAIKGDRGFYRSKDRGIPHNLYIKLPKIKKEIKRKKYNDKISKTIPFLFYPEKKTFEINCTSVTIPYYKRYKIGYKYLKEKNVYRRIYKGKEFKAKSTGDFHDTENVIIQSIKQKMIDKAMRHEMDLYSGGTAEILIGGKRITGLWSRDASGNFIYTDLEYNEIIFNPGKIWVNFVKPKLKLEFTP